MARSATDPSLSKRIDFDPDGDSVAVDQEPGADTSGGSGARPPIHTRCTSGGDGEDWTAMLRFAWQKHREATARYRGHKGPRPWHCQECRVLARDGWEVGSRRAAAEGRPFVPSALETVDGRNLIADGYRERLVAEGKVAKPSVAARGARITAAVAAARNRGELDQPIVVVLEVVEQAIRLVQGDGCPAAGGKLLPFDHMAHQANRSLRERIPGWKELSAEDVERLFLQIEAAAAGTPAAKMLDKHIFRWISGASGLSLSDDGFLDGGSGATSLTQPDPESGKLADQIVEAAAGLLVARGDTAGAEVAVMRIISDRLGADAEAVVPRELLESLAGVARSLADQHLAERDAAAEVARAATFDPDSVQAAVEAAFAARAVRPPHARRPSARERAAWMAAAVRRVIAAARRAVPGGAEREPPTAVAVTASGERRLRSSGREENPEAASTESPL